jgi:hypothetical protein
MVLVTSNKAKRLLYVSYIAVVTPEQLEASRAEMEAMLSELPADFRLLGDFSSLERMEPGCAKVIGKVMETIDAHGVGMVVRMIPDRHKDIGVNILAIFHYRKKHKAITCATMAHAAEALGI